LQILNQVLNLHFSLKNAHYHMYLICSLLCFWEVTLSRPALHAVMMLRLTVHSSNLHTPGVLCVYTVHDLLVGKAEYVLQSILLSGGFDETCSIHFETLTVVKYSDSVPRFTYPLQKLQKKEPHLSAVDFFEEIMPTAY